jgi:hypothetical protein
MEWPRYARECRQSKAGEVLRRSNQYRRPRSISPTAYAERGPAVECEQFLGGLLNSYYRKAA